MLRWSAACFNGSQRRSHWMTIPKFLPKSKLILFSRDQILRDRNWYFFFPRPNFPKPKPRLFFRDQILRNRYRNPAIIGKSLETKPETETSQCPWQFLQRSSPNVFLLFLLCFSTPPEKKISIQKWDLHCLLGRVSFLLFWFFLFRDNIRDFFFEAKFSKAETFFQDQILRNQNRDFSPRPNFPKPRLFFRDQIFQNRDFFPRPNSPKPKPKPSTNWQKSWNQEL